MGQRGLKRTRRIGTVLVCWHADCLCAGDDCGVGVACSRFRRCLMQSKKLVLDDIQLRPPKTPGRAAPKLAPWPFLRSAVPEDPCRVATPQAYAQVTNAMLG